MNKAVVNINQKIGQPNYGSFGASCSFEVEFDAALIGNPDALLAQCRLLGDLARAEVLRELDVQRRNGMAEASKPVSAPAAPARQPGDDFDDQAGEDLRPGDRGYQAPPQRRDRQADREDNQRRYRENYPAPARDDDRPARYEDGGGRREERRPERRSGGNDGPPKTARQFLGWLGKQDDGVKDRVKRIIKAWELPTMMRDWSDDAAADVFHELTSKPDPAYHRSGSGNGNGNGRSY
jgi:hypothetical protein